ncbi:MAG: acyl-CoA reductase [Lutibacter sp.]|uniref:acyl-CoA reductase n=1 Tax=Lutibacter sp. TaxID=1925666 RepID=UPI0017AEB164|nr:acyl-CoA reductase [Lutibacter sp.]MBT8318099.1 acyl-CoA reductase [Lutibacter sp.]NNJ58959.1 acyl-CoA reductase [Lutibacter sp.]
MNLDQRIEAFVALGEFLRQFNTTKIEKKNDSEFNNLFFDAFEMQINRAHEFNGWFNKSNVLKAFESWSNALTKENLQKWTSKYNFDQIKDDKTVAIIMAGNIPLVGFHDFLSVLISGHSVIAKQSSNDKHLLPLVAKFLEYYNPYFKTKIKFTDNNLSNFDAVIATGSNNTVRYFEYYFGKYPTIIRNNRNSVAILTGDETQEELEALGEDIFQYFGLGCRSVSKIFVPKNYNFEPLFNALYKFKDIINYKKYENNYDYNKAVYLMSLYKLQENGFIMLKEDTSYSSPIATLFYEYYDSYKNLTNQLHIDKEKIQCIVGSKNDSDFVKFGQTQHPKLWDYADGIDTISFLLNI